MGPPSHILSAKSPISIKVLADLGRFAIKEEFARPDTDLCLQDVQAFWDELLETSRNPAVTAKYLTAVCNAICVFLLTGRSSDRYDIRQFVCSRSIWFEAYSVALKAFDDSKTKPALQVLEALIVMLREQPDETSTNSILEEALLVPVKNVLFGTAENGVKQSCVILSCFVRKYRVIGLLSRLSHDLVIANLTEFQHKLVDHNIPHSALTGHDSGSLFPLSLSLVFAMTDLGTRSAALKLFSFLERANDSIDKGEKGNFIELYLERNQEQLADFADNIFPILLNDQTAFQASLRQNTPLGSATAAKIILFLSILRTGRQRSHISELEVINVLRRTIHTIAAIDDATITDTYQPFDSLLKAADRGIQVSAYRLMFTSSELALIPSEACLACFLTNLPYLHDHTDAHDRGEIISTTRSLLRRFKQKEDDNARHFLDAFYRCLTADLGPTASYQRHIIALQTMSLLLDVITPHTKFEHKGTEPLLALLFDPFEDVRDWACQILLKMIVLPTINIQGRINDNFIKMAENLSARTCRSDHADALGRLWLLYFSVVAKETPATQKKNATPLTYELCLLIQRLDKHLDSVVDSLNPVAKFPLHGLLLAISYSLKYFEVTQTLLDHENILPLIGTCSRLWKLVQSHLCVDSPERSHELQSDDQTTGPKDQLAYSWRALRDSSLVLQSIIHHGPHTNSVLKAIGNLCMEQLSMLRHRGAFSTVAQTFTLCCDRVRPMTGGQMILSHWLEVSFGEIQQQASRLTRRSAGLPAMIVAIVDAEDTTHFSGALKKLEDIAGQVANLTKPKESAPSLPQVHALNCLKDILGNSKFRNVTEPYVEELLDSSTKSLSSPVWAIRNCGLMLFRACINRLKPHKIVAAYDERGLDIGAGNHRYLSDLATRLLGDGKSLATSPSLCETRESEFILTTKSELVFAGLDLTGRIRDSSMQDDTLNKPVLAQLQSPVWAIRESAARLMADSSEGSTVDQTLETNLRYCQDLSQNLCHGRFLLCRYGLQKVIDKAVGSPEITRAISLEPLIHLLENANMTEASPGVLAALFDIVNDIGIKLVHKKDMWKQVATRILDLAATNRQTGSMRHSHLHSRILLCQVLNTLYNDEPLKQYPTPSEAYQVRWRDLPEYEWLYVLRSLQFAHRRVELLLEVIRQTEHETVLAQAKNDLVEILDGETSDFFHSEAGGFMLASHFYGTQNRHSWNASIRFESHVLAAVFDQEAFRHHSLTHRLRALTTLISDASKDELEESTRVSAAKSLGVLFCLAQEKAKRLLTSDLGLEWCLIAYGLLNDDEEDVREIMLRPVYNLIRSSWQSQTELVDILPSPLAARELLRDYLLKSFPMDTGLCQLAVAEITGLDTSEMDSRQEFTLSSQTIEQRIGNIVKSSTDLFAEERQNLYVDDLREIQSWSQVLSKASLSLLGERNLDQLSAWVAGGLESLLQLLRTTWSGGSDTEHLSHLFQPVIDADLLILMIRVVTAAGHLLRLCEKQEDWQDKDIYTQINVQLATLRTMCDQSWSPGCLDQAIAWAIAT